ncbi:glycoside hydrolase family 10 protein [Microcoleus sp. FACHB-672]|uniref:glycoside hydrolase family 10 protein n=1 Tax=Microcoleus sp. FACHB-672 TaxID=2692825 RepID=UPI0016847A83|nr:glycoside hydrolase family 10 protein [Microcoleus sp. FACHB-672]MBD2042941.1 glycoside hydrolase family 10 protein [Microcoleus sp. FACHB-672]
MNKKPHTWFKYLLCLGLIIALSTSSLATPQIKPASTELRGVWLTNVTSGVLFVPWGINRALHQLSQLNFNTVYPVVWNRGHTFYPSAVAQDVTGRSQEPLLAVMRPFEDTLAEILKQGHRRHLKVIPWFEYGFMAPAHSQLAQRHPDWLTTRRDSSKSIKEIPDEQAAQEGAKRTPQQNVGKPGIFPAASSFFIPKQVWLNPLHPEVQQFIRELIVEVVSNYDVDGIQLDDHFGMPVELGYDPLTVELYRLEHQGQNPPSDFLDVEWMRWRADKITHFMQELFHAVKAVKPDVIVSLSSNSHSFAYRNYLQDWQTWVEQGLVEDLILQVYRNDLIRFQAELKVPAVQIARRKIPVGVGITTGTWRNPVAMEQIQKQVELVREGGFYGVSFFYWESLWSYLTPESPRQRRKGFEAIFSDADVRSK